MAIQIAVSALVAALVAVVVSVILATRHHRATDRMINAYMIEHRQRIREAIDAARPRTSTPFRPDPETPHTVTRIGAPK